VHRGASPRDGGDAHGEVGPRRHPSSARKHEKGQGGREQSIKVTFVSTAPTHIVTLVAVGAKGIMRNIVWGAMLFSPTKAYRHFELTYYRHLQGGIDELLFLAFYVLNIF
jgi:hypothetical protein